MHSNLNENATSDRAWRREAVDPGIVDTIGIGVELAISFCLLYHANLFSQMCKSSE